MKKPLFVIISILFVISEISIAQDWSYYNTDNSEIPGNYIRSFSIKNDTLIIGTQNAGLAIFDQSNWEIFNVENSSIPSNNVNNVIHNDNGIWMNCFIGIGDHYLVRLKNDDWKIWENILNNQKSRFSDIEFDENGIAWMVTGDNSGWVTRFNQVTFESFNSNNSCLPTFSSTRYLPFSIKVIDSESRWIGLLDNQLGSSSLKNTGVVLMENENCIFYNKDNSSFPDNHQAIVEIHKDPLDQNVFWFLSNKGIIKFDGINWEEIFLPSAPNAMTFDNDNRLWVHISNIGMRYYKNGEWFMPIANPSSRVNELKVDGDNRLWASTETNGLAYFNLNELEINSTELVKDEKVSVFPTLISDNITINIENLGLQGVEFKLLDIEGQIHLQEKIIQRSTNLSIPNLLNTIYIYTLSKNNRIVKSGKLLKL